MAETGKGKRARRALVGPDDEIGRGNQRELQVKKRRRNAFGPQRQAKFFAHFVATCNVTASAKAAGIALSTVYMKQRRDPAFVADYLTALHQGYMTLETENLRRTRAALCAFEPDPEGVAAAAAADPKTVLNLLEFHRKGLAAGPGDIQPRRSDVEQARARLEKQMRVLGLLAGIEAAPDKSPGGGEDPIHQVSPGPPPRSGED